MLPLAVNVRNGAPVAVLLFSLALSGARGSERHEHDLGRVDFATSCSTEAAPELNRAVALLHHMTYPQARIAFERVAQIDPSCAMAPWGVAMTLFQPLWPNRPGPEELGRGWEAVQEAKSLHPPTERERLFIAAAEAFFREPQSKDYWARIQRWKEGMENLYLAFPADPEVKAFFALALLAAAQPSPNPLESHTRAAEILLSVLDENPTHPGAFHYLIHANDIPGREDKLLDIVRRYSDIAPRNPHALHMPTHIFTRLGGWREVIEGNLAAAEAALENPAGDKGQYVWDEFPHAIEYLVYADLQRGDDNAAAAQLQRLVSTQNLEPTFKTAFHLSSVPARYALERQNWEEAAALAPRPDDDLDWEKFPWPEAVTWFAKGVGAARLHRVEEARQALERIEVLKGVAEGAGEKLFVRQIEVFRLAVEGWIAQSEGDGVQAVKLMEQAARLEIDTPKPPVTPGPTVPAFEQLGDLRLESSQPEQALVAFERSLQLYPNRFNSLVGAARAARALRDKATARKHYGALLSVCVDDSARSAVAEARRFLAEETARRD